MRTLLMALVVASLGVGVTTAWADEAPTTVRGFCQDDHKIVTGKEGEPLSDEQYQEAVRKFGAAVVVARRYVRSPTLANREQLFRSFGSNAAFRALFVDTAKQARKRGGKLTLFRLTWSPGLRDWACLVDLSYPRIGGSMTIHANFVYELRSSNGYRYSSARSNWRRQMFLRGSRVVWGP